MARGMRVGWIWLFAASAGVAGAWVALHDPNCLPPVHVTVSAPVLVERTRVTDSPAPYAVRRHVACSASPGAVGQPLAALPVEPPAGPRFWNVAAASEQCVIAAWSLSTLVASYDDGATFEPISTRSSPITGADVRADGTVFAMREDFTLEIIYPDGRSVMRTLAFAGEPMVRGQWLVIRTDSAPAISHDDGATWRQLDWNDGYLADLAVLADGTIVARTDRAGVLCDHFGCPDITTEDYVSHLDGRPWTGATEAQTRSLRKSREPSAPPSDRQALIRTTVDSHGALVGVVANRHVVRYTKAGGWHLLFKGEP
jgi:hypothetical protein